MAKKPLSRAIYLVAAKRTPFGAFGGSFKDLSAIDLQVVAAKALDDGHALVEADHDADQQVVDHHEGQPAERIEPAPAGKLLPVPLDRKCRVGDSHGASWEAG